MADSPAPSRYPHRTLHVFLILFSTFEFLSGLTDLPSLLIPNYKPTAGWLDIIPDARRILTPAIAAVALGFALADKLSRAAAAMAGLLLISAFVPVAWMMALWGEMPPLDLASMPILAPVYVYPLLGVAALVLLWRGRLGLAGMLALLPTGFTWLYWIVVAVVIAFFSS